MTCWTDPSVSTSPRTGRTRPPAAATRAAGGAATAFGAVAGAATGRRAAGGAGSEGKEAVISQTTGASKGKGQNLNELLIDASYFLEFFELYQFFNMNTV